MPEKRTLASPIPKRRSLKARQVMPGGVSSPVRAFKAVGGTPLFIKEADGCRITDIDGNDYIDYVASYGPMIVGHANERVVAALSKAIGRGTSYGAPTEGGDRRWRSRSSPPCRASRWSASSTAAPRRRCRAIRLARAATKRDLIVKCIGCYHGHADQLLVEAGSGALTHGTPSQPGRARVDHRRRRSASTTTTSTPPAPAFEKYPGQIAGFIVEPVAGNMGVIVPADGYLAGPARAVRRSTARC